MTPSPFPFNAPSRRSYSLRGQEAMAEHPHNDAPRPEGRSHHSKNPRAAHIRQSLKERLAHVDIERLKEGVQGEGDFNPDRRADHDILPIHENCKCVLHHYPDGTRFWQTMPRACHECVEQAAEFNRSYGHLSHSPDPDAFDAAPLSGDTRGAAAHREARRIQTSDRPPDNPHKTYDYQMNDSLFGSDGYLHHYDPNTEMNAQGQLRPEHDPFSDDFVDEEEPSTPTTLRQEGEEAVKEDPSLSLFKPSKEAKEGSAEWASRIRQSIQQAYGKKRSRPKMPEPPEGGAA